MGSVEKSNRMEECGVKGRKKQKEDSENSDAKQRV